MRKYHRFMNSFFLFNLKVAFHRSFNLFFLLVLLKLLTKEMSEHTVHDNSNLGRCFLSDTSNLYNNTTTIAVYMYTSNISIEVNKLA